MCDVCILHGPTLVTGAFVSVVYGFTITSSTDGSFLLCMATGVKKGSRYCNSLLPTEQPMNMDAVGGARTRSSARACAPSISPCHHASLPKHRCGIHHHNHRDHGPWMRLGMRARVYTCAVWGAFLNSSQNVLRFSQTPSTDHGQPKGNSLSRETLLKGPIQEKNKHTI